MHSLDMQFRQFWITKDMVLDKKERADWKNHINQSGATDESDEEETSEYESEDDSKDTNPRHSARRDDDQTHEKEKKSDKKGGQKNKVKVGFKAPTPIPDKHLAQLEILRCKKVFFEDYSSCTENDEKYDQDWLNDDGWGRDVDNHLSM